MTRAGTRRRHKSTLKGWWHWLPFLVLPFSLFFFETWLRTQTIMLGYETNRMDIEIRDVRERIDDLGNQAANLERMERINSKARDYGLVEPRPNQTEVIIKRVRPQADPPIPKRDSAYDVAGILGVGALRTNNTGDAHHTP